MGTGGDEMVGRVKKHFGWWVVTKGLDGVGVAMEIDCHEDSLIYHQLFVSMRLFIELGTLICWNQSSKKIVESQGWRARVQFQDFAGKHRAPGHSPLRCNARPKHIRERDYRGRLQ
ncbi:hypothetical protein Acr_26g0000990 [Actinidia rufa]|uniref:Uncharacterized protein n=1 Tax=Actinidia rufa TaxID=165716 RepID=A0A7J0H159_9ERIC|nr:hypothetical protein Acr_26g0000990 [Actinidia rufa]